MTNDEINIAIAEYCGWHPHPDNDKREQKFWTYGGTGYGLPRGTPKKMAAMPSIEDDVWGDVPPLPDYCNDFNAMHDAEKMLTNDQADDYVTTLCLQVQPEPKLFHATASQRAKAFLKTIGKWEE